ncbi:MAG: hypothetical protein E7490_10240 [Ruminococcaceae bacterium]|nr:hypothetical protein [Oscillospiraceae bacterium]
MAKLAKRLTAALTTVAVLAASLVTTASAFTASDGSFEGKTHKETYTRTVYPITYTGKFESGAFYNNYTKYVDGYTHIERYLPPGAATTIKTLKTHGILRTKGTVEPETGYTSFPLTDVASALTFESNSTYRVGVAANDTDYGSLVIEEVSATASSPNKYVEKTVTKQTNTPLTAYGNVRYQKGNSVIAGYYEAANI